MKKLAKFLMKPHSVSLSHSLRRLQQFGGAQPPFFLEIHSGMEQAPCRCFVFLEASFLEGSGLIGVHPNENTATVVLKTTDLLNLIREHGNPVRLLKSPDSPSN